ncbi:metallophosphoesterase [Sediminibacterium roseum]|uniref:Metallophosphoesterase n=1 Tax=Sediminibacterium roseum TaxID=1978412 RepID=A0ABW9ZTN3_9BACT|nr:metallophosphoesterase [Sediminibacterium roseum]NCI50470.1 metallophosphoesterase [Sediminibacterium roseum]
MDRRKFLQQTSLSAAVLSVAPASFLSAAPKPSAFRIAFLTDVHVKPTEIAETGMRKAYRHVNALKPSVDFIMNGGDSIMDALNASKEKVQKQWDVWNTVLNEENRLPIRHCIGNHDAWGWQMTDPAVKNDPLYDKNWVISQHKMPGRYYTFEHKEWKFIVLDSAQENNGGYIARIDEEQFAWLENELKKTAPSQHICIVSHIPIVSFCSAVFYDKNEANGDWKISRALLHVDSRRITGLFRSYKNIRCCLSGHIHMEDNVNYRGISYYCNGSICGDWWGGKFHDFDPAYAVFEFGKDGSVKREMVTYGSVV